MNSDLKIAPENGIEQLLQETLSLLEENGVVFSHVRALKLLDSNGARVDFKNQVVRFPQSLVKEAVKKVPKTHALYFRSEESKRLEFGVGRTYFCAGGYGKMVIDLQTGERRLARTEDIEKILAIDDALEAYEVVECPSYPTDVATNLVQIKAAELLFTHSTKPFTAEAQNLVEAEYITKMAEALAEDAETLRKRPIIEFYASCTSPMSWDKNYLDVIIYAAEKGIPVSVVSAPICGVTAPITLAGMLVQQFAEMLSAVTLLHFVNSTVPISLGVVPIMLNFREGNCNVFSPERMLIEAASVQFARLLQLPHYSSVGMTDSKMPTMQAGYEKALGAVLLALSGSEIIGPFGNLDDWMTTAAEIHVIDSEIVDAIKRTLRGIEISPQTCAREIVTAVGPRNSYLGIKHTRKFFESEHITPAVGFKGSWEMLAKEGKNIFLENASKKVEDILRTHRPKPTGDIHAMNEVVKEAEKTLRMAST